MSNRLLKSELKEIVKECLIEILTEGATSNKRGQVTSENKSQRRAAFDHVSWAKDVERQEAPAQSSRMLAESLTNDPILAEVLADSQRTMVSQIEAERKGAPATTGDFAQRKVSESDPLSLFGEASENWAALAFDGK